MTELDKSYPSQPNSYNHKMENILAFIITIIIVVALVFFSAKLSAFDLDIFGNTVARFFNIELKPTSELFSEKEISSTKANQMARVLSSNAEKKLFASSIKKQLVPLSKIDPMTTPNIAATPEYFKYQEQTKDTKIQNEEINKIKSSSDYKIIGIKRQGTKDVNFKTIPLSTLYDSGREGGGGPGAPGETLGHLAFNKYKEKPTFKNAELLNLSTTMTNLEQRESPSDKIDLSKLPNNIYPSLDDDIDALFTTYKEPNSNKICFKLAIKLSPTSSLQTINKDVLFLIDISRSISNQELEMRLVII